MPFTVRGSALPAMWMGSRVAVPKLLSLLLILFSTVELAKTSPADSLQIVPDTLTGQYDHYEDSVLAEFLRENQLSIPARIEQVETDFEINYGRYLKIIIACLGGITVLYIRSRYNSARS